MRNAHIQTTINQILREQQKRTTTKKNHIENYYLLDFASGQQKQTRCFFYARPEKNEQIE